MNESSDASLGGPQPTHERGHAREMGRRLWQIANDLDPAHKQRGGVHLTRGDVAALRRDPFSSMAFYRIAAAHHFDHQLAAGMQSELAWATLVRAMAILAGLHSNAPLGQGLAQARMTEHRLVRLLRTEGEALHAQVIATARFLAAKAIGQDMVGFADLLGLTHRGRENARRSIAKSYFRELSSTPTDA